MINLFKDMIAMGLPVTTSTAKAHCRVFEEYIGAFEIAKIAEYRPSTKHVNIRLHHFRSYVKDGQISIHKIDRLKQPADLHTKLLYAELFRNSEGW
jgi:hypothetical protein